MTAPVLRPIDFQTETWKRLVAIWERRLEDLRTRNDQPQTEAETAHLRGRIEELKFNLAQPEYMRREAARGQEIEPGDVSSLY